MVAAGKNEGSAELAAMNEIRRILRTLEPVLGRETAGLIAWHYEREKMQGMILLPPPGEVASTGAYRLGRTLWSGREQGNFGLREEELPQHVGIFGLCEAIFHVSDGQTHRLCVFVASLYASNAREEFASGLAMTLRESPATICHCEEAEG